MVQAILRDLKSMGLPKNLEGMARFGITVTHAYGVSVTDLRKYAKPYRNNHTLAIDLWRTGNHEARILATIIDDPALVTSHQMDEWVKDFDSWDVCDQACTGLFDKTPYAIIKVYEWAEETQEYQKRAAFALIAGLAWHSKRDPDQIFIDFLPVIQQAATDERNFVKKAVSWALRNIGKRNKVLQQAALQVAETLAASESKSARWIGKDAMRELTRKKVAE